MIIFLGSLTPSLMLHLQPLQVLITLQVKVMVMEWAPTIAPITKPIAYEVKFQLPGFKLGY